MSITTESRKALKELILLLQEIDERWASPEFDMHSEADVVAAHRALMHTLEGGLVGMFESDPASPEFRRIVTNSRKFTGDNSDAIYFDAPVSPECAYVMQGTIAGAVYFSMTTECNSENGSMPTHTGSVLNDTQIDVDENGNFIVYIGGEKRDRNWLPLVEGASRVTTRHYFENQLPAGNDPLSEPKLSIKALNMDSVPAPPNDQSVSEGIRKVANFLRSRTLGMPRLADNPPSFLSVIPNEFPKPVPPGDYGLSAKDATYAMAPFFLGPDEALVITGRWPNCRFANVCLWNRFQQTFDYANRSVSLNRTQTQLEDDGSFRMVIAHQNPGIVNWLDTEGNPFGLVFWRFFLAEGEVETPASEVVKFVDL